MAQVTVFKLGNIGNPCCPCGGTPGTCIVGICVTDCGGSPIVGATVSVAASPTVTCTTTESPSPGCCPITLPEAGMFNVTASAPGFSTLTQKMQLDCSNIYTIALLPTDSPECCTFSATGCNDQTPCGATITIAGETYSLPATVCLTAIGSYPWTISAPNFNDATGTVTITSICGGCSGFTPPTLTPASGFECCVFFTGNSPADAIPETPLFLSDSVYGATMLTFDAGTNSWVGSISGASVAAGCGCPGGTTTIVYTVGCELGNIEITYTVDGDDCPAETGTAGFIDGSNGTVTITSCPFSATLVLNPCGPGIPSIYPSGATLLLTV
jgi:Carboxypeptidase regulatory-like domain